MHHGNVHEDSLSNTWITKLPAVEDLTAVTVVVHQDDLLEQVCRRVVDHAVDGAQDHR